MCACVCVRGCARAFVLVRMRASYARIVCALMCISERASHLIGDACTAIPKSMLKGLCKLCSAGQMFSDQPHFEKSLSKSIHRIFIHAYF